MYCNICLLFRTSTSGFGGECMIGGLEILCVCSNVYLLFRTPMSGPSSECTYYMIPKNTTP